MFTGCFLLGLFCNPLVYHISYAELYKCGTDISKARVLWELNGSFLGSSLDPLPLVCFCLVSYAAFHSTLATTHEVQAGFVSSVLLWLLLNCLYWPLPLGLQPGHLACVFHVAGLLVLSWTFHRPSLPMRLLFCSLFCCRLSGLFRDLP